jgi:hypothetical protein
MNRWLLFYKWLRTKPCLYCLGSDLFHVLFFGSWRTFIVFFVCLCIWSIFLWIFYVLCFFFTLILFRFKHLFLVSFLVQIFYGLVEPMLRVNLDRWTSSQLVTLFLADHFSCWWIFGVRVFFCKHTLRPTLTILFFK